MILALCMLLTMLSISAQPAWDDKLNFEEIEHQLKTEPIVKLTSMKGYLKKQGKKIFFFHKVYVATLANGLKAVFKRESGLHAPYGEIAAYRASKWLGHRLVPPTVLREYEGKKGSLQFFVSSSFDLLKSKYKDKAFSKLSTKVKSDAKLFYFIFGQLDSHRGNQLIAGSSNGQAYLALIDNADVIIYNKKKHGKLSLQHMNADKYSNKQTFSPDKESAVNATYPSVYSKKTIERYKQLSSKDLQWIFEDALKDKVSHSTRKLFKKILARRDHIVNLPHKKFIP